MGKTAKEMAAEIAASASEYVTYGASDIGTPVKKEDAISDILGMDDELIGEGTWYECDADGEVTEPAAPATRNDKMKTIHIPAQDTHTDWFDGYVADVEAATGAEYIGDDSQYGCFRARDGGVWQAYVEPSRSDHETWCITFEATE